MIKFQKQVQEQFNKMCQTGKLFRSSITGQQVWETYINSFTKEQNPIFRDPNSSSHNCNLCNNFLKRYGNVVAIDENFNIITMFDVEPKSEFLGVVRALSTLLKNAPISNVFFETFTELNSLPYESCNKTQDTYKLGIAKNVKRYTKEEAEKFGVVKENEIKTFNHLYLDLPKLFVDQSGKSVESIMGAYRDAKNVFQRAMVEIPLDTLNLVRDLINQGSLLDGQTHLFKVEQFIPLKTEYNQNLFSEIEKDNWCWVTSYNLNIAKFKNELIGVLCTELAEGKELNEACQAWNKRVDPANYMKAVAPITKKQIEEAKRFVQDNGYEASFDRRFANIDDIRVEEIKHINVINDKLAGVSIFDNVKATSTRHKRSEFEGIEEVSIEKFMNDILPGCTSIEAFLTNNLESNLVSLTTANIKDSKPIFKWDNNFSWTFNGNLAGKSQIKTAIKGRGGNVEGVLNIRLAFPDTTDDYDLHVIEPTRQHINYGRVRQEYPSSGMLDLDANGIDGPQVPEKRVENIIYTDLKRMPNGTYLVYVNNYSSNGFKTNFTIEIEFDGEITTLELEKLTTVNTVNVAEIILNNGKFEVKVLDNIKLINSNSVSKEIYGLETNKFHRVNLVCLSPNHWGNNNVGNKYYLFMLQDCKCPISIRSFHNENLIPELADHRKVFETLGAVNMIEPAETQLSGIGFNSSVPDFIVLKLQGTHKRILKINF